MLFRSREKSPGALCRKIALAKSGEPIEIWGDGTQTRSYCYVDDCVKGIYKLMQSDYHNPINIGTDRLVSINEMVDIIAVISGKLIFKNYELNQPQGVKGRNADISLAKRILDWQPEISLEEGLERLYLWVNEQLFSAKK